jgi:hypothetical protein
VDASLVEDGDSRSQLGPLLRLNSKSGFCSSKSREIPMSLSSAESELRVLEERPNGHHLGEFLLELGYKQNKPTKIYEDNQAVIDPWAPLKNKPENKALN